MADCLHGKLIGPGDNNYGRGYDADKPAAAAQSDAPSARITPVGESLERELANDKAYQSAERFWTMDYNDDAAFLQYGIDDGQRECIYKFAEAYAALRTAESDKFLIALNETTWKLNDEKAKVAQLERERDALKEEIVPLIIEVNGAKKSLPIWAGLLSKELERTKAAESRAETAETALATARQRIVEMDKQEEWYLKEIDRLTGKLPVRQTT